MMKWVYTYGLLLIASFLMSQSHATFTTSTDSVTIGDPISLVTTIVIDGNTPSGTIDFSPLDTINNLLYSRDTVNFTPYGDANILSGGNFKLSPNVKMADLSNLDFNRQGNNYIFRDSINIAIYDVGIFSIPNPDLNLSSGNTIPTQSPVITVVLPENVQQAIQDSIQIAPIKPIIEEAVNLEDFKYLFIGLGMLVIASLLIYFFRSKKKEVIEEEEEVYIPAHVTALEKLRALDKKELWQKGEIKAYQSELTFIIREYLENRFHIPALETTTDEILRDVPDEVDQEQLRNILQMADLVKFAKANPPADIHSRFLDQAFDLVRNTKEEEVIDD